MIACGASASISARLNDAEMTHVTSLNDGQIGVSVDRLGRILRIFVQRGDKVWSLQKHDVLRHVQSKGECLAAD